MKKRSRVAMLAMAMLLGTLGTSTAFAAEIPPTKLTDSTETVTDYSADEMPSVDDLYTGVSKATDVEVSQSATFKVIIPKKITLDGRRGQTNDADYNVTVVADIPGDQVINVVPESAFKMSTAGKTDIDATVTQTVTKWSVELDGADTLAADAGVSKAGNVAVADLTAGSWAGQFDFAISITDATGAAV